MKQVCLKFNNIYLTVLSPVSIISLEAVRHPGLNIRPLAVVDPAIPDRLWIISSYQTSFIGLSLLPGVEAVSLPDNLSTGAVITDTGVQQTATGDSTVSPVPNTGITPVVVIDLKLGD